MTALAAMCVTCGAARAATVSGHPARAGVFTRIVFHDRRGESNDLLVSRSRGRLRFTDRRSREQAGPPCRQLTPHRVSCPEHGPVRSSEPRIWLGAGNDRAVLATAYDAVYGGTGNDVIDARHEPDTLLGGDLWAGPGNDRILGGPADDIAHGGPGDDVLIGAGGHDLLDGEGGNDVLRGGPARDIISGDNAFGSPAFRTEGDDRLYGGPGPDVLYGGPRHDALHGGGGDDLLDGELGGDRVSGGPGIDALSYWFDSDFGRFFGARRLHKQLPSIRIRFDDEANDGPPGEHDNIRSDVERSISAATHTCLPFTPASPGGGRDWTASPPLNCGPHGLGPYTVDTKSDIQIEILTLAHTTPRGDFRHGAVSISRGPSEGAQQDVKLLDGGQTPTACAAQSGAIAVDHIVADITNNPKPSKPSKHRKRHHARPAAAAPPLWRISGHNSAAVPLTRAKFVVQDTCAGATRTAVIRGRVRVRNLTTGDIVTLGAGQSYLAAD